MLTQMSQLETIEKIILNTVAVSIPEELFLLMFTLILVGEFEYWTDEECKKLIHRYDYVRILVPVLAGAFLSNILRYSGLNFGLISLIPPIIFFILIILTNDIFGDASALKWSLKAFIFLFLGLIIIYITEFAYIPYIMYAAGKSLKEINDDLFLNFLFSIPSRLIQYFIIAFFIVKRRTLLKANIIKIIFESRILSIWTLIIVAFDFSFMFIMAKVVGYEKAFASVPGEVRFIVIIAVCVFPILNISALLWCVYYVENRAKQTQKEIAEKLNILSNEINSYTIDEKYDNIKWKLHEIDTYVIQTGQSLYPVDKK